VGDVVERGGILGEVGSTGRSTGPHLHYEVFNKDRVINPAQVLPLGSS
jgi:murein DD-endopeptidase MepM/ murein hydrolase activator NlpD